MSSFLANAVSFDQNLGGWDVSNVNSFDGQFGGFLEGVNLSRSNYDGLLVGWSQLDLQKGLDFDGGGSQFGPGGEVARQNITDNYNWSFSDGGLVNLTPKSSKFNGSTGFNSSRLDNTSLVLEVRNRGRISWVGSLDVRLADFDSSVEIEDNRVFVNSSRLRSQFDSSAVITFYNITWDNPEVLRNGEVCEDCEILSYVGGDLEVRVPGFSTYTTREGEEEEELRRGVRASETGGENITVSEEDLIQGKTVEVYRLQNMILSMSEPVTLYIDTFGTSYVIANVDDELIRFNQSETSIINVVDGNVSVEYEGRDSSKYTIHFQLVKDEEAAEEVVEDSQIVGVGQNRVSAGDAILNLSREYSIQINVGESVEISSETEIFNMQVGLSGSRSVEYNNTHILVFEVENIEGDIADLFLRLEERDVDVEIVDETSYTWVFILIGIVFLVVFLRIYLRRKT